ncbi:MULTISPECIES: hypothetical protein [Frankia]|uniref:hypothetical protein n=1 Tax=Frankia TaxID=1854 RepID=UPI0002D450B4|nr:MULTISPECIES: hypothetical protein [Frankia]
MIPTPSWHPAYRADAEGPIFSTIFFSTVGNYPLVVGVEWDAARRVWSAIFLKNTGKGMAGPNRDEEYPGLAWPEYSSPTGRTSPAITGRDGPIEIRIAGCRGRVKTQ